MGCNLVAYYRVSTDKQGVSGLGLEAQTAAVVAHAAKVRCDIVATFTEVESGKRKDRPEMLKAIATAKRTHATLVVAKLDRLARNVAFLSGLMESGVDFVALDCPDANKLTLHILAAVAEEEARLISTRTRAALAALKARGVKLGMPENLTPQAQARAVKANRDNAIKAYGLVGEVVRIKRDAGLSYGAIAGWLNDNGHATRTGARWSSMQVKRVADRLLIPQPS
jgi:DNA invertase Pin-like site-specific DNA recombinase